MARKPIRNPFRRYKDREDVTYAVLAERLNISEDYARKLGAGLVTSVSPAMARKLEDRSDGRIKYLDMMRWAEAHLDDQAA